MPKYKEERPGTARHSRANKPLSRMSVKHLNDAMASATKMRDFWVKHLAEKRTWFSPNDLSGYIASYNKELAALRLALRERRAK